MPAIEGQSIAAVSPGSECPRPPVPIGPLRLFLLPEMAVMMTNVQKETKERCTQDQTPREIGNSPATKQFPRPDSVNGKERPNRARLIGEWALTIVFGLSSGISAIQLATGSADQGEWFALVLSVIVFALSLTLVIRAHRGHTDF